VMDTLGLDLFELPDVQCHYRDFKPADVATMLYNTAVYVFIEGYSHSDFGRGAAISLLMLLIVAVLSIFYVRRMVKMGEAQ